MKARPPVCAVATVAPDLEHVEALPWLSRARHRHLDADELRTAAAAVEDAGAVLVSVPLEDGSGWRCYVREGECPVSLPRADLVDVERAVQSVRSLAAECEAPEAAPA